MFTIEEARKAFADAFKEDKNFRFSYESTIACMLYEDQNGANPTDLTHLHPGCNNLADRLIKLIFED